MKRMLLLTMTLPLVCLAGDGDAAVELAADRTEVAIAANAPQTVVFAAGEMTNFLSRVFGVRIPLVRKPTPGKYALFLGDSPEVRAAGIDVGRLPHDGFEVCVTEDAAYIAGVDDPEQDLVRIARTIRSRTSSASRRGKAPTASTAPMRRCSAPTTSSNGSPDAGSTFRDVSGRSCRGRQRFVCRRAATARPLRSRCAASA